MCIVVVGGRGEGVQKKTGYEKSLSFSVLYQHLYAMMSNLSC